METFTHWVTFQSSFFEIVFCCEIEAGISQAQLKDTLLEGKNHAVFILVSSLVPGT